MRIWTVECHPFIDSEATMYAERAPETTWANRHQPCRSKLCWKQKIESARMAFARPVVTSALLWPRLSPPLLWPGGPHGPLHGPLLIQPYQPATPPATRWLGRSAQQLTSSGHFYYRHEQVSTSLCSQPSRRVLPPGTLDANNSRAVCQITWAAPL